MITLISVANTLTQSEYSHIQLKTKNEDFTLVFGAYCYLRTIITVRVRVSVVCLSDRRRGKKIFVTVIE